MNNRIISLIVLLILSQFVFSQNVNINYEVRVNAAGVRSTAGNWSSGCSCWESGDKEYTAKIKIDHTNYFYGSSVCMTCNINGDCDYGGGTVLATRYHVATQGFTVVYEMFEDDDGDRCIYNSADDCGAIGSYYLSAVNTWSPSAENSYSNYTENRVYDCGGSGHWIRLDNSWRYSAFASSITPSCNEHSRSYASGGVRSWSVYLNSGVTYNFNNCNSATDTHLRLYASDGYSLVSSNNDGCSLQSAITYTCTSSGFYYLELSQHSRNALTADGTLYYSIVRPTALVLTGSTICVSPGHNYFQHIG